MQYKDIIEFEDAEMIDLGVASLETEGTNVPPYDDGGPAGSSLTDTQAH